MYKVLLVDDEYFPREALKMMIPWEEYGCVVCGEGKNGFDGMEKALELMPDIVLTDINMPFMDGLDMIMHLQDKMPDTLFSIVTGYSEFEYAKRGIELGVEHYILKPINDSELVRTLQNMVGILDKRHEKRKEYESLKFWGEKNTVENRQKFLKMLLIGEELDRTQFLYECKQLDVPLKKGGYGVCCLKIDSRTYVHFSQEAWQKKIEKLMEDVGEEWQYQVCYMGNGNLYLIFYQLDEQSWNLADVSAMLQKIQIRLMQEWVCTVKAGMGSYCKEYLGIAQSREKADQTIHEITVSKLIREMLDCIHADYGNPDLSLKGIAEKLFVNYSYLSAQFTKEIGMSASHYIARFRMTKAADFLRGGEENMVEIACCVGYVDVKYFYRCFKKEFGITPYQYIDILREAGEKKSRGEVY